MDKDKHDPALRRALAQQLSRDIHGRRVRLADQLQTTGQSLDTQPAELAMDTKFPPPPGQSPPKESPQRLSSSSPALPPPQSVENTRGSVVDALGELHGTGEEYGVYHISDGSPHADGDSEAPFTDSGYASMARAADQAAEATPGSYTGADQDHIEDSDETRTVISTATTVVPTLAQQSISEICDNIYDKVRRNVDEGNRKSFLRILPDQIKAFAIRLAHVDPSGLNRQIMHFVYSRHL